MWPRAYQFAFVVPGYRQYSSALEKRRTKVKSPKHRGSSSIAIKRSRTMFGLSNCPAGLPYPASAWWNSPLGQAAGPVCQQHTTNQWGVHPSNSTPTWAGPTTHIHFWGEQTAQQMHQALGHQPPIQPLTIMAYPSHQPLPQQNCHCTAIPLAQAQPKEQDLLLKCMAL